MIEMPDGTHVPAIPGKYRVVPAPDLNEVEESRFLLEYDFPFLIVREVSTRPASSAEQLEASRQAGQWYVQHPRVGGFIQGDRSGYLFNAPSSRRNTRHAELCQFIPDLSYIDQRTWSRLSPDDKRRAYVPCVPSVVIELMSETDRIEDLQAKVAKFVSAGTREGVVVDTRRNRMWICNRGQQPFFDELGAIEFDAWPDFTLDCVAIQNVRTNAGLP